MRYRSKPTEVEAIQWTGDNLDEIRSFCSSARLTEDGQPRAGTLGCLWIVAGKNGVQESVPVPVGHWIVRNPGDDTDYWPVDPEYFAAKYEPVDG